MRVLVVEDEPRIAADVSTALAAAGYVPEIASDGEDAWFRGDTQDYGLIVLDLGLPCIDGLAVLKRWRAGGRNTPILVLTARGTWTERVEGIDAGADDYLPKPFRMEELIARVRALIRRSAGHGAAVIEAGGVSLDTRQMRVSVDGIPVTLSALEYRLVAYLLHHRGASSRRASSSSTSTVTTPAMPMRSRPSSPGCDGNWAQTRSRPGAVSAIASRIRRNDHAVLAPEAVALGRALGRAGAHRIHDRAAVPVRASRRAPGRRRAQCLS